MSENTVTSTVTTHTPINLAPGIDLMVRVDLADDSETARLVEKCKELMNRAEHVDTIKCFVERWRAADDEVLFTMLEMLGWLDNRDNRSTDDCARAILALLDIAPLSDVITCAAYCYEMSTIETEMNS